MKKQILYLILSLVLLCFLTACGNTEKGTPMDDNSGNKNFIATDGISDPDSSESAFSLNIEAGDQTFIITLYDNSSTQALLELLPLDLDMSEMNGNEKYFFLPGDLPTDSKNVGSIQQGDFMLYGDNCLVLFYKSFSTSYSYTPLGRIDNPKGFAEAVGNGSIQIKFYQSKTESVETAGDTQTSDVPAPNDDLVTEPPEPEHESKPEPKPETKPDTQPEPPEIEEEEKVNAIRMFVGEKELTVKWEDNESVNVLKELVKEHPLTIQMSMYGGFEQVGDLGFRLPRNDVQTTTSAGDIVLYSGNQIVIFYGPNSWAYTKLGKVSNMSADEMAELIGNGDIVITLSN